MVCRKTMKKNKRDRFDSQSSCFKSTLILIHSLSVCNNLRRRCEDPATPLKKKQPSCCTRSSFNTTVQYYHATLLLCAHTRADCYIETCILLPVRWRACLRTWLGTAAPQTRLSRCCRLSCHRWVVCFFTKRGWEAFLLLDVATRRWCKVIWARQPVAWLLLLFLNWNFLIHRTCLLR